MATNLLDSSALLAFLLREPGQGKVEDKISTAAITAVNACEAMSKLLDMGAGPAMARKEFAALKLRMVAVDEDIAWLAATYRPLTRDRGLSMGDRICLAAGKIHGWPVLTADKAWKGLDKKLGVKLEIIR